MENTHFSLGDNFGVLCLNIAQEKIEKGKFEEAIKFYLDSFPGMEREHALSVLRNEFVLIPTSDTVIAKTDEVTREENRANIRDWKFVVSNRLAHMNSDRECINKIFNEYHTNFGSRGKWKVLNCDFAQLKIRYINFDAIIEGIINGKTTDEYEKLQDRYYEEEDEEDKKLFDCMKYLFNIYYLYRDTLETVKLYEWLKENDILKEHIPFAEDAIEKSYNILNEFVKYCNFNRYSYPPFHDFKVKVGLELQTTKFGKEYVEKDGIVAKEIMDGYDAGWLSPEGVFYGENGEVSMMIHMNLAEKILKFADLPINTTSPNDDYRLELNGWMKIHHDEVYGYFKYDKNDTGHALYCPTEIQVQKIAQYIKKYHKGIFYNHPQITGGIPIKASRLEQADEIQLHEIFTDLYHNQFAEKDSIYGKI